MLGFWMLKDLGSDFVVFWFGVMLFVGCFFFVGVIKCLLIVFMIGGMIGFWLGGFMKIFIYYFFLVFLSWIFFCLII